MQVNWHKVEEVHPVFPARELNEPEKFVVEFFCEINAPQTRVLALSFA